MKNQYFGDNRDLFKYDLITEIMLGMPVFDKFTFIPMLTPNDTRSDGDERDTNKAEAGFKNNELVQYLRRAHRDDRDFRVIEEYFAIKQIKNKIYAGHGKEFFSHKDRKSYFNSIGYDLLSNSLVFLDPDNGLEIKKSTERHVLYSEIEELFKRSNQSKIVIMVIQFFPREQHEVYIQRRLSKFSCLNYRCAWISDSNTVFFLLTKHDKYFVEIKNILRTYQAKYMKTIKIGD